MKKNFLSLIILILLNGCIIEINAKIKDITSTIIKVPKDNNNS